MRRTIRLCAAGALAASVVVATPAAASGHLEVVLDGVDNGRGLTFDGDDLYVASSGTGGEGACLDAPEGEGSTCYGETGAILMLADAPSASDVVFDDATHVLVDDLPSLAPQSGEAAGGDASGPADVSIVDGRLYYTIGLGADPAVRDQAPLDAAARADWFATLRRANTDGTGDEAVADLGAVEAGDPDGEGPDSNPFGVVADAETVTVLDSGGNTILEVDPITLDATVGAVLPPTMVPAPAFLGAPAGTNIPTQAVPTQLAALDGGGFAVGLLTGFPFPAGGASVWAWDGADATPWYAGFTNVMDVAEAGDGSLYVLELAHDGLLAAEGVPAGALVRVTTDGDTVTRELLADDIPMPGGMAIGPDGMVYMTTMSAMPAGQVVRFDPTGEPLLAVTDDVATTDEDQRVVAGDGDEDDFTTVVADVTANDEGVATATPLGVAQGAVASGSIVYQPPAHFAGSDPVPYRGCDDDGHCLVGVLTVTVEQTATDRIAGENRVRTAVTASQGRFPDGAPVVLLARSDLYPDALAGGPLAHALGGPILLTSGDALDPETAAEIARLGPATVWILGGEVAISVDVQDAVTAIVADTQRIQGENRFATAVAIRDQLADASAPASMAYVVEGYDADPNRGWPDAVAVSALASFEGQPILLAETDRLPDETAEALAGIDATVVGGPVAISEGIRTAIDAAADTVDVIAGDTRYGTSQLIAEAGVAAGMTGSSLSLVSGGNWPDALVAGPLVAGDSGAFLLVHPSDLASSPETVAFVQDNGPFADVDLFGGPVAISTAVEAGIAAANTG